VGAALFLPATRTSAQTAAAKRCERAIATRLARCFTAVSKQLHKCYLATGRPCPQADVDRELGRLGSQLASRCADPDVQQLGYGPLVTTAAVTERLQEACQGEVRTLAARTFGGPHGALLAGAAPATTACLAAGWDAAAKLVRAAFVAQSRCVGRARAGRRCEPAEVDATVAREQAVAEAAIAPACPNLRALIGLAPVEYAERALAQARCMVATAHPDPAPLTLDCGPHAPVTVPPRGQWVQVVLDEALWGTRCGDGSPYAFWLRLAPDGAPLENVVVDLQGGGVCTNESECLGVGAGLFRAIDNHQPDGPGGGYRSTNPAVNPFWDWTMIALAYCNQDVYTGGGATDAYPGITVHRFGAVNLRAGLRYVRDVLWRALDAGTPEGYRPDRLRVLFGGVSAGGFGVSYNHHYVLDDLRWVNTTAVPDSALGLNNGSLLGVAGLGFLIIGPWGGQAYQPPYCLTNLCAIVPWRQQFTAPRLKGAPFQQILNVSNQVDNTQRATTYFSSSAAWTNAVRQSYCATRGLNGIRYFLPAQSTSIHGMLQSDSRFTTMTSDGMSLRDWLAAAMTDPDAVVDRVEEGTLASNPSIAPFACAVD
jgi:hypothetical protein